MDIASVHMRLLPQPGFDLENFVVQEDPAFGAEPMLRAQEVTAYLRLWSLMRGRLEIARLDLSEPSLNLVRGAEGHWNIENLIERAEKIPIAPTAKAKRETRPGFPYIDCSDGRINFKLGSEKKPYALTGADFSLWQESENAWGMRLKARPVRTDFNLTDTGLLHVSGTWQRAASLRATPMLFNFVWQGAQLGQLTKLAYGNDKGWRGSLSIAVSLAGTPADSQLNVDAAAEDFRRFDVLGGGKLHLAGHCSARYSTVDRSLSEISCLAPVGAGVISVKGRIEPPLASPTYDLVFSAQAIPIQSLVAFARHATKDVPDELEATGQVVAELRAQRQNDTIASWKADGKTSGFHLKSGVSNADVVLDDVPFTLASEHKVAGAARATPLNSEPQVDIGPFRVALGRPSPIIVQGSIRREGYAFDVRGEAQLQRLFQAARMIGIPAPQTATDGVAKLVDLQLAGNWSGPEPLRATGKAQLRAVHARVRGFNAPLDIAAANLTLTPEQVTVQSLSASAAGTSWSGSLVFARPCAMMPTCTIHFDLHANEIGIDRLNQLLNPQAREEPWYQILSSLSTSEIPYLMTVNALGKLNTDRLVVGNIDAKHATASVELKHGKLRLSNFQAEILGGRHDGEWRADFTAKPPEYSGNGTLQNVALSKLAQAMNGDWITGTASASYRANTSGLTVKQLIASATASVQVDASAGALPHVVLTDGASPLQVRHLTAHLALHNAKLEIQTGKLESATDIFHLNGTASLTQGVNLKLTRDGASGFSITGSLARPHVSTVPASETRAALKP